ncbi:imidazoleglycerol-phosphate dehydratase HisB [Geoglobus acetivorans]|uniref:Imidazoleglycerol-phosphate dehydratase n=1 Tax=Geoglobus acetivorans TaxID=565033 RepID=A0ABZ3GZE2_GEOAI|nr:imidazoleglycerol-phosphate dehydratase HisB [Geoglobus acetivorans]
MVRVERKTKEVEVVVKLSLGGGEIAIDTGIGFLDHMLTSFAFHSGIGLEVKARGDLHVDEHHTVEDVAITLGRAFRKVIEGRGLYRFGSAIVPMDESVAICGVDVSGRGYFVLEGEFGDAGIKGENAVHFLDTFCRNSGINVYLQVKGRNEHHKMESAFKALALALRQALKEAEDVRSTKGSLD